MKFLTWKKGEISNMGNPTALAYSKTMIREWNSLGREISKLGNVLDQETVSTSELSKWLGSYNKSMLRMRELFDKTIITLED